MSVYCCFSIIILSGLYRNITSPPTELKLRSEAEVFKVWIYLKDTGLQFGVFSMSADGRYHWGFVLVSLWIFNLSQVKSSDLCHLCHPPPFCPLWNNLEIMFEYRVCWSTESPDAMLSFVHFRHKVLVPSPYKKNLSYRAAFVTFKVFVLLQVL